MGSLDSSWGSWALGGGCGASSRKTDEAAAKVWNLYYFPTVGATPYVDRPARSARRHMNDDVKQLLAEMREMRAELRRQAKAPAESLTVMELYRLFEASRRGQKGMNCLHTRLRATVAEFADREATSIRPLDWSQYREKRKQQEIPTGKPGRFYSDKTLNLELTWFKIMLNYGVVEGRIDYNPISVVKRKRLARKHRETAPTESDVGNTLKATTDPRKQAVFLCATNERL